MMKIGPHSHASDLFPWRHDHVCLHPHPNHLYEACLVSPRRHLNMLSQTNGGGDRTGRQPIDQGFYTFAALLAF